MAPPGIQMCKPWYNHVAYMVTQQSCTYNAPVKSCPTKDNVMVDCELTLVFAIGPDPVDVKNFVYNLGALKFSKCPMHFLLYHANVRMYGIIDNSNTDLMSF